MLQSWDFLQAYAFPPFAMIRQVLVKLRLLPGTILTLIKPFWLQREWFPDHLDLLLELKCPLYPVSPHMWDLVKVLSFLRSPTFEPLSSRLLRVVTMKVLFLLSLATAKHVGELQAVAFWVAFSLWWVTPCLTDPAQNLSFLYFRIFLLTLSFPYDNLNVHR